MSANLLSSKVVIQEEAPRIRSIPSVPTSNVGAVGVTERGPVGVATLCSSFEEFQRIFGGFTANADLALALQGLYDNGGNVNVFVVRVVHYTTISNPSTKTSAAATVTLQDRAGTPVNTLKIDGKYDGAYANNIKIQILAASNGDADRFDLAVLNATTLAVLEYFPNLKIGTANAASPDYVVTVIGHATTGSRLITATDLLSGSVSPQNLPAIATSAAMTGGNDGLTGLVDTDFIGDASAKNGIRALDLVQDISLLIVPGRASSAVHNAMITYCEVTRDKQMFAILDPPAGQSTTQIVTYVTTTASLENLSEHGAIYWPRIKIVNPSTAIFGLTADGNIVVPPSGHIAGMFARTDASQVGGVYQPPAGVEKGILFNVVGFESNEVLEEAKRDIVFPRRINPITKFPGSPIYVDGARSLKGNGNFPSVSERRGVIFIEQSIKLGLQVFRQKNNTAENRSAAERTVRAFLLNQMRAGAFRSNDPATAFFVDFGDALNPPSVQFAGQMKGRVGLATNKVAEFIIVSFSQDTRALDTELAASAT